MTKKRKKKERKNKHLLH